MRFSDNRMDENKQNLGIANPYEALYRSYNLKAGEHCSRKEAESIARHLGYLHNAFGTVVKDFINIIKYKFPEEDKSADDAMLEQKSDRDSGQGVEELAPDNVKWREQYAVVQQKNPIKKKQQIVLRSEQIEIKNFQKNGVTNYQRQSRQQIITISGGFNPSAFEYKPEKAVPAVVQLSEPENVRTKKKEGRANVIDLDDDSGEA